MSTPERQTITVSICDCGMPVDEHSNWPRAGHIRATRAACITVADHEAVVVQAARDEREKIADELLTGMVRNRFPNGSNPTGNILAMVAEWVRSGGPE